MLPCCQQYDWLFDVGTGAVRVYQKGSDEMTDYDREQRREAERRERMQRETLEPRDEPIGAYGRGERHDEPVAGRERLDDLVDEGRDTVDRAGERVERAGERVGERVDRMGDRLEDRVDPYNRSERVDERVDPYNRPERVGSSSGLWLTVGIIVLVVIALIVVMLLLPLL